MKLTQGGLLTALHNGGDYMNVLLQNIYEQPSELKKVLDDLCGPKLAQVKEICNMLQIAEEIVLTSMGSAIYSLMPMYEALLENTNKKVTLIETADLILHPERMNKQAFYIMMSRSGESREVADFSKYLEANGYVSLAITMTPDSTMAQHCTYMLHDIASYDAIVCIKAYSSMSLCGLFLASMIGRSEPDAELVANLHAAFDWLENNKEKLSEEVAAIPYYKDADGYYMISRGYGINMMRSASLWMEETAKTIANIMSTDNFYHGPMEIIRYQSKVKQEIVPVMLNVLSNDRSKMIWGKINEFMPRSIYIGPEGEEASGGVQLVYPTFGLQGAYTTLVIAMYLQLMSFHGAVAKGLEPGEFLDEGWVVL